ncbi:MAG: PQQ-like beta-propeller repeat protein [Acidobacteria bacterium]|nr:PQQ-like beta-propeller repeat protein [Acidobacteriota bacterium]
MPNTTFRSLGTDSRRKVSKLRATIGALLIAPPVAMFAATGAVAEDWPQFRGANGSGLSVSTGLPEVIGHEKNVVWKTPLPPGHSSPVLTRDRVFVTAYAREEAIGSQPSAVGAQGNAREKKHKLLVICLDLQTGKLLWRREVPRPREGRLQNVNDPASPSPVTDGTNV